MVLRIFKMIATSACLTALVCAKFVFGRGFAPDSTGELTALLQTLYSWFRGPYYEGERRERGNGEKEGRGREPEGTAPPFANS